MPIYIYGYKRITATENHSPLKEIWLANLPSPKLGEASDVCVQGAAGHRVRGTMMAETVIKQERHKEQASFSFHRHQEQQDFL